MIAGSLRLFTTRALHNVSAEGANEMVKGTSRPVPPGSYCRGRVWPQNPPPEPASTGTRKPSPIGMQALFHDLGIAVSPGAVWTTFCRSEKRKLLQVHDRADHRAPHAVEGLDLVGNELGQFVNAWSLGPRVDVVGPGHARRFRNARQIPEGRGHGRGLANVGWIRMYAAIT